MPVDLIDKVKPKNAGNFAMVELADIRLETAASKTIATGTFAYTTGQAVYSLSGEGAAADDLTGITGGDANVLAILRKGSQDIRVRDGQAPAASTLSLGDNLDCIIDNGEKQLILFRASASTGWIELWRNFPYMSEARVPILDPIGGDQMGFQVTRACRLIAATAVRRGGTSVDNVEVLTASDRSAAGTNLLSSATQDITSATTGTTLTLATNPNVASGNWVWFKIGGVTGAVSEVSLRLVFIDGNITL